MQDERQRHGRPSRESREQARRQRKQRQERIKKLVPLVAIALLFLVLIAFFASRKPIQQLRKPAGVTAYAWQPDMIVYGEGNQVHAVNLEGERLWSQQANGTVEAVYAGDKNWGIQTNQQLMLLNARGENIAQTEFSMEAMGGKMVGDTFYVWTQNALCALSEAEVHFYGTQERITDVTEVDNTLWVTDASVTEERISSNLYQLQENRLMLVYPEVTDVMMHVLDAGIPLALTPHTGIFYDTDAQTVHLPEYNEAVYHNDLYLFGKNLTKMTQTGESEVISLPATYDHLIQMDEGVLAYGGQHFFYYDGEESAGQVPQKLTHMAANGQRILVDTGDVWIQATLKDLLKATTE